MRTFSTSEEQVNWEAEKLRRAIMKSTLRIYQIDLKRLDLNSLRELRRLLRDLGMGEVDFDVA